MRYENNKSGNGGVITLNNDLEEIGRLTYTIFPEENKLIISFVLIHSKFTQDIFNPIIFFLSSIPYK